MERTKEINVYHFDDIDLVSYLSKEGFYVPRSNTETLEMREVHDDHSTTSLCGKIGIDRNHQIELHVFRGTRLQKVMREYIKQQYLSKEVPAA